MISFLKRCWRRRWIRGLAWTFITLLTAGILLFTWVNWMGARAWEAAQKRLATEKLTLDFRETLADPVPDELNFCATPLLRDLAVVVENDAGKGEPAKKRKALTTALGPPDLEMVIRPDAARPKDSEGKELRRPPLMRPAGQKAADHMREWAAWLRAIKVDMPVTDAGNPAREVLAALAYQDKAVAELAARLELPHAQVAPALKTQALPDLIFYLPMPQLSCLQASANGLALRALAAAHAGEVAKAHEAVRILLRLAEATAGEPMLISLLVSCAMTSMAVQVVEELSRLGAGSAEDFRRLSLDLARLDFTSASLRAWHAELAAGVNGAMYLKRTRDLNLLAMLDTFAPERRSPGSWISWAIPGGLIDWNAANIVNLELDYIIRPLRDEGWSGVLKRQADLEATLKKAKAAWYFNLDKAMPVLIMPAASKVTARSVHDQCRVHQAIIACELERWRQAHQSYPESLDALKGEDGRPLPLDAADGQPMKYRRSKEGGYVLWSLGFDSRDDGGTPLGAKGTKAGLRPTDPAYKGDWVWEVSAPPSKAVPPNP